MSHQRVDLRTSHAPVANAYRHVIDLRSTSSALGDRAGHMARVEAARAAIPIHVQYVVGLDGDLQHRDGRSLPAGTPITVADIKVAYEYERPLAFKKLVATCRVLENYRFVPQNT